MPERFFMGNLRLLWSSNAFWAASGYGVQGASLLPRLAELPEFNGRSSIAQHAWFGLQGGIHEVNGFKIYPAGSDPYGNDIIGAHTRDFRANLVITLIDAWVLQDTTRKVAPALWCPWLPIDADPIPPKVLEAIKDCHLPLTYSKWGHDMLTKAGMPNEYIPHGIEPAVYRVRHDDFAAIDKFRRDVFGAPSHLTIMVAANKGFPDRKAFQVQLRAWANFAKDKPNARLYIHTEPTPMYGGIDFGAILGNIGIADKVMFPDRYQLSKGYPPDYMSLLYNSADVLLGASCSEGFGIPLIEAQACGVPVVTTNFASMPELVRWGYHVEPLDYTWMALNSWWAWPDHRGITDALNELYAQWHDHGDRWPVDLRLKAQDAIHGEYSWDSIVHDNWAPLMTRLSGEVSAPPRVISKVTPENNRREVVSA